MQGPLSQSCLSYTIPQYDRLLYIVLGNICRTIIISVSTVWQASGCWIKQRQYVYTRIVNEHDKIRYHSVYLEIIDTTVLPCKSSPDAQSQF